LQPRFGPEDDARNRDMYRMSLIYERNTQQA
jgi:hypothetical protein